MDRTNNMRFLILGALLTVVAAGGYAPAIPSAVYGAPRVELVSHQAALPAPVYSVPRIELAPQPIAQSYRYEVISQPRPVEILAPQPTPILRSYAAPALHTPVYSVPRVELIKPALPVASSYSYRVDHIAPQPIQLLKTYAAPAPVYAAPAPVYAAPAPVYAAPRFEIPAPRLVPHATQLYREYPIAPHSRYGVPQF